MAVLESHALVNDADVAEYLGLNAETFEDKEGPTLRFLINSVSTQVENFCQRRFLQGATITEVTPKGTGEVAMRLRHGIPASITSIEYWDGKVWVATTGTFTTKKADGDDRSQLIYFTDGTKFSRILRWRIIYVPVWKNRADLPDNLQVAVTKFVAALWKKAKERTDGVTSFTHGDETITISDEMPKDVRRALGPYVAGI